VEQPVKHLNQIRREFKAVESGQERIQAIRGLYQDLARAEMDIARNPTRYDAFYVQELRELVGLIGSALNRAEAAEKKRLARA